jgi:hypothetical protein
MDTSDPPNDEIDLNDLFDDAGYDPGDDYRRIEDLDIEAGIEELSSCGEYTLPEGTSLTGFVTIQDSKPPRQCDNCIHMEGDACIHPEITADSEIGTKYGIVRDDKGHWLVPATAYSKYFQNR